MKRELEYRPGRARAAAGLPGLLAAWIAVMALPAAPPIPKNAKTSVRVAVTLEGSPVNARDWKASVDGTETRVTGVRGPGEDAILILVLDVTGDLTLADLARHSLVENLNALPQRTWAAVMRSQDGLQVLLDPSQDRARVAEAIRSCPVSGKAGLLDSITAAAKLGDAMLAKANIRLGVLYVTDSNIYNYREDFTNPVINWSDSRDMSRHFPEGLIKDKVSKLDAALAATETPVFIVHLDYRSDRLNEAYQSGLMQLAATTGGSAVFCRSTTDIGASIEKVLESIRLMHTVTVELPKDAGKTVQVQLRAGDRQLSYRNRFALAGR